MTAPECVLKRPWALTIREPATVSMRHSRDREVPVLNPQAKGLRMSMSLRRSFVALFAVLALFAASCGTSNEEAAPVAPVGASDEPSVLPPNPNPDDSPVVSGACIEDEPDCIDTIVVDEEPSDLPAPSDVGSPSGMVVDGGLTVADALLTDASGTIAVKGFLLVDAEGARLCELLAESFPPQCGGASIPIENFDETVSVPLIEAQGVTWSDQYASFLGEVIDGTFVVDATATQ